MDTLSDLKFSIIQNAGAHAALRRRPICFAMFFGILLCCTLCNSYLVAQDQPCDYNPDRPNIEHARVLFKSLDYDCAKREVQDYLRQSNLSHRAAADAYVLLAAVDFAGSPDSPQRREKVLENFRFAFREYPEWKGNLDISSTDFFELMREAKRDVDAEKLDRQIETEPPMTFSSGSTGPSSTYAWIGTGLFAASLGTFIYSTSLANDRWDTYESDPTHSRDLYDSYTSANNMKKVSGVAALVTGVATGYLWVKYLARDRNASPQTRSFFLAPAGNLHAGSSAGGLLLVIRF